jgi:hypothetical protein
MHHDHGGYSPRQDPRDDVRENDTGRGDRQNRGDSLGGASSQIPLSRLLNSLDCISAREGRLFVATTNRYHALDPALTRPGRMGLHQQVSSKRIIHRRFYVPGAPEEVAEEDSRQWVCHADRRFSTRAPWYPRTSSETWAATRAPPYYYRHSARVPMLPMKIDNRADRTRVVDDGQLARLPYVRQFQAVDDTKWCVKDTQDPGDARSTSRGDRCGCQGKTIE